MKKAPLLFLCHRIPFPPNKGDKIATFNLLKFLSSHFDVFLGYFVDERDDLAYVDALADYCVESFYVDICDRRQSVSGLKALYKGLSVTEAHYLSDEMQTWVDTIIEQQHINNVFVYSSGIYQFVENYTERHLVIDLCDIDSDKWRQYAENKPWFLRWIYQREQRLLSAYEQEILAQARYVGLVTEDESKLFCSLSPEKFADKIKTIPNGVDTVFFDPNATFDRPAELVTQSLSICFTGAMDYWANEDAVVWFCQHVWPKVRVSYAHCQFNIVGGNPTANVQKLAQLSGVNVTGRVPDVRPYIAEAQLVVAPMRIARGVQNKVLEGMSMAKVVVMTSMAQEGIEIDANIARYVVDDADEMAVLINQLLAQSLTEQGQYNRQWILNKFSWNGALKSLPTLFE